MATLSTQEQYLKNIADAIREKEGTTEPIPANTYSERIMAIKSIDDTLYNITVTASPPEGGTVKGGGKASSNTLVAVSAEASKENGYVFDGWKENGNIISKDSPFIFPATLNQDLIASFIPKPISGENWTTTTLPQSAYWYNVAYGNGRFITVASGGWQSTNISSTACAYSLDGISWVKSSMPKSSWWHDIAYGNGKFVAVSLDSSNNIVGYTTDGVVWNTATLPEAVRLSKITYANDKFFAVSDAMTDVIYWSSNGIDWNKLNLPKNGYMSNIAYGNGIYVILGASMNYVLHSLDGINWEESTSTQRADRIVFGNGMFIGIRKSNIDNACISYDGLNWSSVSLPATKYWNNVIYGDDKFIAIASNKLVNESYNKVTNIAAYSYDGINWTQINLPISAEWYGIAYGDNKFVITSVNSSTALYSIGG